MSSFLERPPDGPPLVPASTSTTPRDYVDLDRLEIPVPPGWSNKREDLNISYYFAKGCTIPETLNATSKGWITVQPIITDLEDTYFFQAMGSEGLRIFIWNAISGRMMIVERRLSLKETLFWAGVSILDIPVTKYAET